VASANDILVACKLIRDPSRVASEEFPAYRRPGNRNLTDAGRDTTSHACRVATRRGVPGGPRPGDALGRYRGHGADGNRGRRRRCDGGGGVGADLTRGAAGRRNISTTVERSLKSAGRSVGQARKASEPNCRRHMVAITSVVDRI